MDKLLDKDITIKILAVFLAIILWARVQVEVGSQDRIVRFEGLPVTVRNVPDDVAVVSLVPPKVNITVRGQPGLMDQVNRDSFEASVNLAGAEAGQAEFFVGVTVPRGVQLVRIDPDVVAVHLAPIQEKEIPVEIQVEGKPQQGFIAGQPVVNPPTVRARGASPLINQVAKARGTVDLQGAERAVVLNLALSPVDSQGTVLEGVALIPNQVKVSLSIEAVPASIELPVEVAVAGNPGNGLVLGKASSDPSSVRVIGPDYLLRGLSSVRTKAVDVAGATGDVETRIGLDLPPELRAEPETVLVTVKLVRSRGQGRAEGGSWWVFSAPTEYGE